MPTNPFFTPSTLPYGLPPFAEITQEHFLPAFERGFAEQLAEVDAILADTEPPTVANTLIPLERSGATLHRVASVFYNKSSSDSDGEFQRLEEIVAPQMSAHGDAIRLNPALFERIAAIAAEEQSADAETRYLIERYHTEYVLAGAGLDDADKATLREYNQRLATLTTRFEKNLLTDTNELALVITDAAELDGLTDDDIAAAASAASDRGLENSWVITLVLPTGHPYLTSLTNRDVRQRLMAASRSRGLSEANDNRPVVLEIVRLRAERAALLGFDSHAAWVTADETARTPDDVADMLGRLAPPAAANARLEQGELERVAGHPIEAWDWAFFTEKVREQRFAVDTSAMRQYFEAERVLRDGVFFAASRLYGVTFTERTDLIGYHPEVRVFEVRNDDGSPVGLYLLDLYTRDTKKGGAWMNPLISQSRLLQHPTVVVNNLNVPKPPPGEPTLLTLDLVTTLFHEFGHALHGLFAEVTYPRFSGTNVYRDFVEFPSQVNEMWMLWPEVLANYAIHHRTGERMPQELVDRLLESAGFNEGFGTSEYLAAALLDQAWHSLPASTFSSDGAIGDVEAFEAEALSAVGLGNPAVPTRYSTTYFAHIFAGGYSAGYYSYIWSEVLDADTVEWFRENGGLTQSNGDRFRRLLLGVGGSKDPLEAYREFRGRPAIIDPLLKRRGLHPA